MFGGVSAEHEVSVVTGLQAFEHVDRSLYRPHVIYVDKNGSPFLLEGLQDRKGFLKAKRTSISFGKDEKGGYLLAGLKRIRPYAAYLAFHGGTGEGGALQGLLESVGIPFTSSSMEASAIAMNKWLTKKSVEEGGIRTVPAVRLFSNDILGSSEALAKSTAETLSLPLIVKPAHLGSSIGIKVAKTEVELEKALIEAGHVDTEIVVEKFLSGMVEYNCAVRSINGVLEASEVERPVSKDEILSFADKYERGAKKTGGMASLQRELPAKIPETLTRDIQESAKKAFTLVRAKGMVRIDFMHHEGVLYLTEVNPIPGSMAYYLWEASGIPYNAQITALLEQAVQDKESQEAKRLEYHSDIIERFVAGS